MGQLSGELPTGTITEETNDMPESKHLTLSEEIMEALRCHYMSEIPEFKELMVLYDKEKAQAKVKYQLKQFPSPAEWSPPLSQIKSERCAVVHHRMP
jgi:hypothetical protein